jgi:hypothetical protein
MDQSWFLRRRRRDGKDRLKGCELCSEDGIGIGADVGILIFA